MSECLTNLGTDVACDVSDGQTLVHKQCSDGLVQCPHTQHAELAAILDHTLRHTGWGGERGVKSLLPYVLDHTLRHTGVNRHRGQDGERKVNNYIPMLSSIILQSTNTKIDQSFYCILYMYMYMYMYTVRVNLIL